MANLFSWNVSMEQDPRDVIEVVGYPNNPDGEKKDAFYTSSAGLVWGLFFK